MALRVWVEVEKGGDAEAAGYPRRDAKLALAKRVLPLVDALDQRKRHVLSLRYGLKDGEPQTLQAIGTKYELTRERIRQIQNTALKELGNLLQPSGN